MFNPTLLGNIKKFIPKCQINFEFNNFNVNFSWDCLAESTRISIDLSAATCKSCYNNINRLQYDISQYQIGLIHYHKIDTYINM